MRSHPSQPPPYGPVFCGAGVEYRKTLCGGISPERGEMYILSYKLAFFCGSRVKVRLSLRGGHGFSRKRPKSFIYGYKLAPFCGAGVEYGKNSAKIIVCFLVQGLKAMFWSKFWPC